MRSATAIRFAILFCLGLLTSVANAHFQLQFPPPRGVFDEDKEPTFCDGYTNPSSNRTQFPLSSGYFTINVEHPKWVAGVLVSTAQNATSFAEFSQVNSFSQAAGTGLFCLPLDFSKSNVTGLQAGQNVTIQIVVNGGDGALYQCADLTLASSFNLSTSVSCSNSTSTVKSSAMSNFAGSVSLLSAAMAGISGLLLLY